MRILMLYVSPASFSGLGLCGWCMCADRPSGLDNAGKTTIVKKIMNEDVTTVSPTLGFIIKTIDFMGYAIFAIFWGLCCYPGLLLMPVQIPVEYM